MNEPSTKSIAEMYRVAVTIRLLEERLLQLFSQGKLSGTTHTYLGQEGLAAAMACLLHPDDVAFSSHRCHGHYVMYGAPLDGLLGEVMGRECGVCGGRGGSQHLHFRRFFSSGVQGGIAGNATGAALALKLRGERGIAIVFLGDGTMGEGLVYESLNFAQLNRLPVLFVVENNRIAQTTLVEQAVSGSILNRARAFGMAGAEIESNDAVELHGVAKAAVEQVRSGNGPYFLVVHTYRMGPHSKGDDTRSEAQLAPWRSKDPLTLLEEHLSADQVQSIQAEAHDVVESAVAAAEASPPATEVPPSLPFLPDGLPTPWVTHGETTISAINRGLHEILRLDQAALLIGEDLLDPYGGAFKASSGLSTAFPDRVLSTPISEAGIVSWGVGAALLGGHPIAEIMFGDFTALAADQLINHAAKYAWVSDGEARVPLVVRTPMGGRRGYGPTHSQSIEKHLLGVGGLRVMAVNPLLDPAELMKRALKSQDPTLFIENKVMYSRQLLRHAEGRIGDFTAQASACMFPCVLLGLGDAEVDAVVVTYGEMALHAMQAAETLLMEQEVNVAVLVLTQLSPFPVDAIVRMLPTAELLVTVEEAGVEFGVGAEVLAVVSEKVPHRFGKVMRLGASIAHVPAAKSLEEFVLPDTNTIIRAIEGALG